MAAHFAVHFRQIQQIFPVIRRMLHRMAHQFQRVHRVVVAHILHSPVVHIGRASVKGYNLGVMLHSSSRIIAACSSALRSSALNL